MTVRTITPCRSGLLIVPIMSAAMRNCRPSMSVSSSARRRPRVMAVATPQSMMIMLMNSIAAQVYSAKRRSVCGAELRNFMAGYLLGRPQARMKYSGVLPSFLHFTGVDGRLSVVEHTSPPSDSME